MCRLRAQLFRFDFADRMTSLLSLCRKLSIDSAALNAIEISNLYKEHTTARSRVKGATSPRREVGRQRQSRCAARLRERALPGSRRAAGPETDRRGRGERRATARQDPPRS